MDEEDPTMGQRCLGFFTYHWRGVVTVIVPLVLLPLIFMDPILEYRYFYLLCVMTIFWITEALPIAITSTLPIILLPPMGILHTEIVCLSYFNDAVITCMGGLIVALTLEHSNLHRRVALSIISIVGCDPRRIHFFLILFAMFVSMWINNASTTAMMCPILKAILEEFEGAGMTTLTSDEVPSLEDDPPFPSKMVICYYLGVAYASSIGGCGTLMGTETNTIALKIYDTRFPKQSDINFGNWMMFNILPMLLHTILLGIWMQFQFMGLFRPNSAEGQEINAGKETAADTKQMMMDKRSDMGSLTCHELQVALLFMVMIVLFFTSRPVFFTGWTEFFNAKVIKNSFCVMLVVICYFALPVNYVFMKYCICKRPDPEHSLKSLVNWKVIHGNLPWSVLLLLGSGYAMTRGFVDSGLSKSYGNMLSDADSLSPLLLQLVCIVVGVLSTSLTANIAICNVLVPIFQEVAVSAGIHPLFLTLPTTVSISMAFFLPVSTAPNAIAGGFTNMKTRTMMVAGIVPTLIVIIGLFIFSQTWIHVVYSQVDDFPAWGSDPKPK